MSCSPADVAAYIERALNDPDYPMWPIFLSMERDPLTGDWSLMLGGEFRDFLVTIVEVERITRGEPIELW